MIPQFLKYPGGEKRAVLRVLEMLHQQHEPIRLEIEGHGLRFKTTLTVSRGMAAVSIPMGAKLDLPVGTNVRFRVPERRSREIRMQVVNPYFELPNRRAFFICSIPSHFQAKTPRQADRYFTSRFKNLELFIPAMQSAYRIVDLSLTGCKISPGAENLAAVWEVDTPVAGGQVQVGNAVRIPMDAVVPKMIRQDAIGLEFDYETKPKAKEHLTKLIKWLENWEEKQSKVLAKQ